MPKFEDFGDWIREVYGDQGGLAAKLKPKVVKNTVSSWKTGRNRIPPEYQKQIRALGYDGPLPEPGGEVTMATLEAMQANIISRVDWVREEVRKENGALAEALDLILKHLGIELKPKR